MKDLRSWGGSCLEAPRGVAVRAREASTSDGGIEAVRLEKSDGDQPGGRAGGVALLAVSSEGVEASVGAVIDQWLRMVVLS